MQSFDFLCRATRKLPDRTAVDSTAGQLTFVDLVDKVNVLTGAVQRVGLGARNARGRVCIGAGNTVELGTVRARNGNITSKTRRPKSDEIKLTARQYTV